MNTLISDSSSISGSPTDRMSDTASPSKPDGLGIDAKVSFLTRYQYSGTAVDAASAADVAHAAPATPIPIV